MVVRKRYVTGFLRQMNVRDLIQQRGHLSRATTLQRLLMVQRLFTTKHPDEMEDVGIAANKAQDRRDYPGASPHSGNILAGAVDEFLEHLDMTTFFDQFVEEIPKHRRTIRQFTRVMHHSADQRHLELGRDLESVRGNPAAHVNSPAQRLFYIPIRSRERSGIWIQLPTRIVLVQRVLGCVPVDINVRIETQTSRRTREGLHPVEVEALRRAVCVVDRRHFPIR